MRTWHGVRVSPLWGALLVSLCGSIEGQDLRGTPASPTTAAAPTAPGPRPKGEDPDSKAKESSKKPAPKCNEEKKKALAQAAAGAFRGVFYDNDFAYVLDPCYVSQEWGDLLKRQPLGPHSLWDFGGQFRLRFMDEQNMRGLGITGQDDDFVLYRTRLFANAQCGDRLRFYAEVLDAQSNHEEFSPRLIEVNRFEMLNLFVDLGLVDQDETDLSCRLGRQELLYGSERLVSPLDWANTRRTFDGVKFFGKGKNWNLDLFATQPVFPAEGFDTPDSDKAFGGAWGTYKPDKVQTIDGYVLQYNDSLSPANFRFTTIGSRWFGNPTTGWLWDAEGGVQFGENSNGSGHGAGFATGGMGYRWDKEKWKPQLWCYYDWASGGNVLGAGNGFNHLFPLGHKYLGFMDLFGRSNIQTPNIQLTTQPHEKIKVLLWCYYFFLATKDDTPYRVTMAPYNPTNRPVSQDLGYEVDLLATVSLGPRAEMLWGYSHFFAGRYFQQTPGVPYRDDADLFYLQYQLNF